MRSDDTPVDQPLRSRVAEPMFCLLAAVGLMLLSYRHFLLFHTVVELVRIAIAWAVFLMVWNTRQRLQSVFLVVVGTGFLFVGALDLVHTISYKGMGIFAGADANLPTQLWIAARYLEAALLILGAARIRKPVHFPVLFWGCALVTGALFHAIFTGLFPDCYIEGIGLTPFKRISEYVVCLLFGTVVYLIHRNRKAFPPKIYPVVMAALCTTILAEIAFTFYISVYGFSNLVGHLFKLASCYLFYRAIIRDGLRRPYDLLYRELSESRNALTESERQYKELYERAPIAYQALDGAGRLTAVNGAWLDLLGYSRDEVLGRSMTAFIDPEYREYLEHFTDALHENGKVTGAELKLICSNGRSLHAAFNAEMVRQEDGRGHIHAVFHDISREKAAHFALMESRERFRIAAQCVSDLILEWEPESGRIEWFGDIDAALGYAPGAFSRTLSAWMGQVHPADHDAIMNQVHPTADAHAGAASTFRIRMKDGRWRFWQIRSSHVPRNGRPARRFISICTDITEKRQSEEMLSLHVDVLERMVQGRPLAELCLKVSARIDALMPDARSGVVLREPETERFRIISAPALSPALKHAIESALASDTGGFAATALSGERQIISEISAAGNWEEPVKRLCTDARLNGCWMEPIFGETDRLLGLLLVFRPHWRMQVLDHAEARFVSSIARLMATVVQKRGDEAALRASESKFRQLAENIEEVFWIMDHHRMRYVSPAYAQIFGRSPDHLFQNARAHLEEIHPEDRERIQSAMLAHTGLTAPTDLQYRILRPDGEMRWVWARTFPIRKRHGETAQAVAVIQDITEKKQAETEILRLATAIEQLDETILITDAGGRIEYVNAAFEKLTGYSREEAIGRTPRLLKSGNMAPDFYHLMWTTILDRRTWKGTLINQRKDGSLYEKEMSITPIVDSQERITHFVSVSRDITRQRHLEALLRQSQKMEAIGTLAGGIAHDFNNILFPIIGYTEMLMNDSGRSEADRRRLGEVLNAANRASDLVRQILTFSRQTEQEMKPLHVNSIIKEVIKLSRASLPATIRIRQEIDPDSGMVLADPTQIHQIVMNLMTNAYHAMQETGGELTVSLCERMVGLEDPPSPELEPGIYICIQVADTGTGMPQEMLERIFEPYFTTKEKDKGTGLGLAVVQGIVKNAGGAIQVESIPGEGSTFRVLLPRLSADEPPEMGSLAGPLPGGNERILLVDDEDPIARMEKQMLERLGYDVTVENSSTRALDLFQRRPDHFDLIITDMTMPTLTGDQLAQRMLAIRPDLPIIICTGFSELISEQKAKSIGIRQLILKPVLTRDLALSVRHALEGETDPSAS